MLADVDFLKQISSTNQDDEENHDKYSSSGHSTEYPCLTPQKF